MCSWRCVCVNHSCYKARQLLSSVYICMGWTVHYICMGWATSALVDVCVGHSCQKYSDWTFQNFDWVTCVGSLTEWSHIKSSHSCSDHINFHSHTGCMLKYTPWWSCPSIYLWHCEWGFTDKNLSVKPHSDLSPRCTDPSEYNIHPTCILSAAYFPILLSHCYTTFSARVLSHWYTSYILCQELNAGGDIFLYVLMHKSVLHQTHSQLKSLVWYEVWACIWWSISSAESFSSTVK